MIVVAGDTQGEFLIMPDTYAGFVGRAQQANHQPVITAKHGIGGRSSLPDDPFTLAVTDFLKIPPVAGHLNQLRLVAQSAHAVTIGFSATIGIRIGQRPHLEKRRRLTGATEEFTNRRRRPSVVVTNEGSGYIIDITVEKDSLDIVAKSFQGCPVGSPPQWSDQYAGGFYRPQTVEVLDLLSRVAGRTEENWPKTCIDNRIFDLPRDLRKKGSAR